MGLPSVASSPGVGGVQVRRGSGQVAAQGPTDSPVPSARSASNRAPACPTTPEASRRSLRPASRRLPGLKRGPPAVRRVQPRRCQRAAAMPLTWSLSRIEPLAGWRNHGLVRPHATARNPLANLRANHNAQPGQLRGSEACEALTLSSRGLRGRGSPLSPPRSKAGGRRNEVAAYVPPYVLDEPMSGAAIGEVIASRVARW